jgi:hypothetical protein
MKNRVERYFTPADFLNLLEGERQSFILLDRLRRQRWQCAWPEESPEGHAVSMMLRDRTYWLRN